MKIVIIVIVIVLLGVGGWVLLSGKKEVTIPSDEGVVAPKNEDTAVSGKCRLPTLDVLGEEISEIPRYAGSVRTYYEKHEYTNPKKEAITANYVSSSDASAIVDFYTKQLRADGWEVSVTEMSNSETQIQGMKKQTMGTFLGITASEKYPGCIEIGILFDAMFYSY